MPRSKIGVLAAAAALLLAAPAAAQKAKDTLHFGVTDPYSVLDPYHFPQDEAGMVYRSVYETLVSYDERAQKFVPRLAKAWRRIDQTTLEFDLRDDVKFHNGNRFDAEDVKHTIEYLGDPKVRIRFKGRYDWVAKVEVLGPYKVRITGKAPNATDLTTMAYRFFMYDAETHKSLANPADYGRLAPHTTGPYKVVSVHPQQGITLERFEGYTGNKEHYRAPIKTLVGHFVTDQQTQIAEFFTGGLQLLRNVTADNAREIAQMPNAKVTPVNSGQLIYVTLDAAGRSDSKVMTDVRVRKAVMMAINREALAKSVIPGGDVADIPDGICFKVNIGCKVSVKPYGYDPAEAKRLLAEAGHAAGFPLEIKVHAPIAQIGEAVAGQLRNIGIRATTRPLPLALYVRLRGDGQMTAFTGFYPTAAQPDVDNLMDFFFAADRDYWKDPLINRAAAAAKLEFDDAKRADIYLPALNRINELAYIVPISELPIVYAHTNDVRVLPNPLSALESRLGDFAWAN